MEQGAKALLRILLASLALGALVIAAVPAYRQTAAALLKGTLDDSPIWTSNAGYYAGVGGPAEDGDAAR